MRGLIRAVSGEAAIVGLLVVGLVLWFPGLVRAEGVAFDPELWDLSYAQVVEHEGRAALAGSAVLKDVQFDDGVIEVDVFVTGFEAYPCLGSRSYPGINFRMSDGQNGEQIYVRPHRAPLYPDAAQYTPIMNGIAGWQLYSGPGMTAAAAVPAGRWFHLRLDVSGAQARLFVDNGPKPALVVDDLKRGRSAGAIGISGPLDGTTFFSNFSYRHDDGLVFDPAPPTEAPPGTIRAWEVSQAFPRSALDLARPPSEQDVTGITWRKVESDPSGLVDIARYVGRTGREPDCVMARTVLEADEPHTLELELGYSDAVTVFLNGRPIYSGTSGYQQRDPSFLGIAGLFDTVYLPLERGENELALIVVESFGGWGFACRDAKALFQSGRLAQSFDAGGFLTPESVAYDPERGCLYVSNYDMYGRAEAEGGQYISKLSLDGDVLDEVWVPGLRMPTGLTMAGDVLWAVDRQSLSEIDPETGAILKRHPLQGARFPNDVAVDAAGMAYVSDTATNTIYRLANGQFTAWLVGGEIAAPNALAVAGDELLVGTSGDRRVKAFDVATGGLVWSARLGAGNIDGIKPDGAGRYLVSHWEGRLYSVGRDGSVEKLLDTSGVGRYCADFEYVPARRLVVIPTFADDRVVGYLLENGR